MAEAIRFGDPAIEVRLRRNARARPQAFLRDQEGWLRRHIAGRPAGPAVGAGTVLPFAGGTVTVAAGAGRGVVLRDGVLTVPGGAGPRVAGWLREEARRRCLAAVDRHAPSLERTPGRISLRDPRSRWGSCTSTGDLMFSWRLAMAPPAVLDYVVAHEVAHLAELNHSPRFWAVVARLCPDYQASREWLRRHGAALHGFDFR